MSSHIQFSYFSFDTFGALVQSRIVWHLLGNGMDMTLSAMWLLARSALLALDVNSIDFQKGESWTLMLDLEYCDNDSFLLCELNGVVRSVCKLQCQSKAKQTDRRAIAELSHDDAVEVICILWLHICRMYILVFF